jgi:putative nucleotidyltransferase with HDIG domain
MLSRLAYRSRQFRHALLSSSKPVSSESLLPHLTPDQLSLFHRMQPSEQAHAYQIFKALETAGQIDPDLLTAALLHDVGKNRYPLSMLDRIMIVLGKRLLRGTVKRWAAMTPNRLNQPFAVAEQHAEWGADMASQVSASSRTVELIRHHHDPDLRNLDQQTQRLLAALQAADDEN